MAGAGSVVRGEGEEAIMRISWAFKDLVLQRQPIRRGAWEENSTYSVTLNHTYTHTHTHTEGKHYTQDTTIVITMKHT